VTAASPARQRVGIARAGDAAKPTREPVPPWPLHQFAELDAHNLSQTNRRLPASMTRLEQSDVNMSRTFGCKSLIIFERALGGEKV
jgi:hypothetical protein